MRKRRTACAVSAPTWSLASRVSVLILGLGALAMAAPGSLSAEWLVTKDGHLLETEGPWEVRGSLVVYRQPWAEMLVSLPVSEVDLQKSNLISGVRDPNSVHGAVPGDTADDQSTPRALRTSLTPERRRLVENIDDERPSEQISFLLFNRPLTIRGSLKLGGDAIEFVQLLAAGHSGGVFAVVVDTETVQPGPLGEHQVVPWGMIEPARWPRGSLPSDPLGEGGNRGHPR